MNANDHDNLLKNIERTKSNNHRIDDLEEHMTTSTQTLVKIQEKIENIDKLNKEERILNISRDDQIRTVAGSVNMIIDKVTTLTENDNLRRNAFWNIIQKVIIGVLIALMSFIGMHFYNGIKKSLQEETTEILTNNRINYEK